MAKPLKEEGPASAVTLTPAEKKRSSRTLFFLYCAHILQCLSTTIREQAAPDMVFRLFNNDMVSSAKFLGNYDSFSGLIAFLVSPSFGGLSDQIGRKPFLLLWPVASTVLSGVVAAKPTKILMFIQMGECGYRREISHAPARGEPPGNLSCPSTRHPMPQNLTTLSRILNGSGPGM